MIFHYLYQELTMVPELGNDQWKVTEQIANYI
jgi:hypothetical protein